MQSMLLPKTTFQMVLAFTSGAVAKAISLETMQVGYLTTITVSLTIFAE